MIWSNRLVCYLTVVLSGEVDDYLENMNVKKFVSGANDAPVSVI